MMFYYPTLLIGLLVILGVTTAPAVSTTDMRFAARSDCLVDYPSIMGVVECMDREMAKAQSELGKFDLPTWSMPSA
jgi:hypothetical protein